MRNSVSSFIELDAQIIQSLQYPRPDFSAALTDAACEKHHVQSAECGDVRAKIFSNAIAVRVECQNPARLTFSGGFQDFTHIARDSRQTQQTAFLIQKVVALRGGHPFS